MSNLKVTEVSITEPITVIGKIFTGDYSKSHAYITEVKNLLRDAGVPFNEYKVMGVYYDNPAEKKTEELKSFQGVFVINPDMKVPPQLEKLQLEGNYLYVKATGDIMKAIHDGYGALFNYIAENKVNLKSPAGYQVSTFDDGNFITEIYMEAALSGN